MSWPAVFSVAISPVGGLSTLPFCLVHYVLIFVQASRLRAVWILIPCSSRVILQKIEIRRSHFRYSLLCHPRCLVFSHNTINLTVAVKLPPRIKHVLQRSRFPDTRSSTVTLHERNFHDDLTAALQALQEVHRYELEDVKFDNDDDC